MPCSISALHGIYQRYFNYTGVRPATRSTKKRLFRNGRALVQAKLRPNIAFCTLGNKAGVGFICINVHFKRVAV